MRKSLDSLWEWFEKQGLYQEEFPYFIEDIFNYIDQKECATLNSLNQELETLGWGIQMIDEAVYTQMMFLHQNKNFINLKGHLDTQV